ncbi:MAG: ATP-binding cassette domain-containing protein [Elusimicrobia bacterium]|nr:ATP-binding cassette domain-containing protein [Elusimicrobiota bacterium]
MADIIEVEGLTKSFGDFRAVDGISFSVPAGAIFGFLGPNGAGKTTTIKMLTTILSPDAGTMRVDGHDPVREPLEVRRSFGIVFQDSSVDSELTAFENMELHGILYGVPARGRKERIERLLSFVELADRRNDVVKQFSGGMIRRLEVARAFLHEPKILFLDEPTVGLDPQTRNRIWSAIQEMVRERGTTVLFTTHYMEEAEKVAGQAAIIDYGKIVARGTPASIKETAKTATLEEAFIALTGHAIRDEESSPLAEMRQLHRLWGHRR